MLNPEEVAALARLAKLSFHDELEDISRQLIAIVEFANAVQNEPVSGEVTLGETADVLREDTMAPSYPQEEILANAPHERGFFYVPRQQRAARGKP